MVDYAQYGEMKPSREKWLGEIPASWKTFRLKHIFSIKKDIAGEEGHIVLSVTQKGIRPKAMSEKGQFAQDYSKYQLVNHGDFVMNHMDLLTGWVDISQFDGVTSPDYRVFINTKPDQFDSGYYRYIFQLCYSAHIFYGLGQGVAGFGRWRLPSDMFLNFVLPAPSISEQHAIAAYLDDRVAQIDSIIAEAQASIEKYKQWKAAKIYEAVTKGIDHNAQLVNSGSLWIGKMPSAWRKLPLKRVILRRDGGAWGDEPTGDENDRVCMRVADFDFDYGVFKHLPIESYTKRAYPSSQIEKLTLDVGHILVEKSGGGEKTPVGRAVLFDIEIPALFANFMDRLVIATDIITPEFFEYYWQAMYYLSITRIYIKQTTGIQNLNISALLEKEIIIFPPIKEQRSIAQYLNEFSESVKELVAEKEGLIKDLESYKRSLIFETVTGKRRVDH